eukprot:TRINITY_DN436_c12_g1_i1.p1 TRINITY_DN436_c12_g1~~TRINITY_DN436_c12_g1_i1.p1  ORF type:complete len:2163 (+),score=535.72 TRINITY_DN436_c12_g1_i1:59-6547(+)
MKGFTAFVREPPSENSSWFSLGKKEKTKNYVVTGTSGQRALDDLQVTPEQAKTTPDVDNVMTEKVNPEKQLTSGDSFGARPPERERWRRNTQKTKMKEWWVADNMAKQCYECRSTFSVLTRRHHCRVCGQIFCWKCSANFLPGERLGFSEASLRLCVCCYAMWQADKGNRPTATAGTLSSKAQGIARQATRQRSISDTRTSHSPSRNDMERDNASLNGSIKRLPLSKTDTSWDVRKSPAYSFTPDTLKGKVVNSSVCEPTPQPDWDAGSDDLAADETAKSETAEWTIEDAESSFLTHRVGADNKKMMAWRNKVGDLVEERLRRETNATAAKENSGETFGMICPVMELPDAPNLLDETHNNEGDECTKAWDTLEEAAHKHLKCLVYRLLADLIVTGTDTRGGSQPTDDKLLAMVQHLKPIISRALWAKSLRANTAPKLKPAIPPALVSPRVDNQLGPPEDCQYYASSAAASVAGALLGQTIDNQHDLDMAVIEAVRRRPDNNPESIVELVLGSPKISVCISKNRKVLNARCFENKFINSHGRSFVLSDAIDWVKNEYTVGDEEATEGLALLYKRNVIACELRNEPEQLERRIRIGGNEGELTLSRQYRIIRDGHLVDDDSLTHEDYLEMLAGFREHAFEDDAKTVDAKQWTQVICRLAWKAAKTVFPSVWRDKDEFMDIREYIKVIKVEGGDPWESEYVCGSVVPGNLANRKMPGDISNPRVLLVGDHIDYEPTTVVTDFASLVQSKKDGNIVMKENDGSWLEVLANKVKLMNPDLVLVEHSVNLRVQEQLCESGIALATSVSPKALMRVRKTTHASIVHHIARIPTSYLQAAAEDTSTHTDAPKLGKCKGFTMKRVGGKSLMYIYGGDVEKGCAVVLRGASTAVLRRLKEVLKFAAFMAHNLVLETNYFEDAKGYLMPGTTQPCDPLDSGFEGVRDNTGLLSSSLCVDFQIPDLLTAKRKRHDDDEKHAEAASSEPRQSVVSEVEDRSMLSIPHMDSIASLQSQEEPKDKKDKTSPEKKREQLLTLCRDLGYLNPLCHQSILVHHTITRVSAHPSGLKPAMSDDFRDRGHSIFSDMIQDRKHSIAGHVNTSSGAHLSGKSSGGQLSMSTKDLASQAHQFGHLGNQRDVVDEHNPHQSFEKQERNDSTLRMPGDTSREFKKLLIEYYKIGRNKGSDIPLVFYLAEHFSLASTPGTSLPTRQYSHNKGRLTVVAERVTDDEFYSDYVLMWTYCKICKRNVSPRVECSRYTLSYSFGKFLETSFYNFKVVSRACNHSVHGDLIRCFGQTVSDGHNSVNVQVKFEYVPVEVYTLEFPELELHYDATLFNNFVTSEFNDLLLSVEEGYKNISDAIDEMEGYQREVGLDETDDNNALRQRLNKESKAQIESAQAYQNELCAATVMDMNAMRKDLHAALQGWGKEISEKWLAARAADEKTPKPKSKWRDMLRREENNEKGSKPTHQHCLSNLADGLADLKLHTDSESCTVDKLMSALAALEKDVLASDEASIAPTRNEDPSSPLLLPPPPSSPSLSSLTPTPAGGGELIISNTVVAPLPASLQFGHSQKRGASLPQLPSLIQSLPAWKQDELKSNSSGMSPPQTMEPSCSGGLSPQPTTDTSCLEESPPSLKSPMHSAAGDRRTHSMDFEGLGGERPLVSQVRKSLSGQKQKLAKEIPQPKLPANMSSPGVLVNLATGVEDLTVIVRLDEPTSVIAYTLCSEQYKRACQPITPPSSPLRNHKSPYLFRGAPVGSLSTTTPPDTPANNSGKQLGDHPGSPQLPTPMDASIDDKMETVSLPCQIEDPFTRQKTFEGASPEFFPSAPPMEAAQQPPPTQKNTRQQDIDNLLEVLGEKMRRVEIKEFEEVTAGPDPKTTHLRFACNVLCARQFAALRQFYCKGDESTFIASLSRCMAFAPTGGRTGASYYMTRDSRYVLKAIKTEEMQHFEQTMSKKYFEYIARAIRKRMPTLLTKIMGVFKITIVSNGTPTHTNWLLMDNLFYNRKVNRTFDLKGSRRNRYQANQNAVLLDENLLHLLKDGEWLFTKEESKEILTMGVHNDTLMLRRNQIMDYSMLLGVDDTKKEIYVGIIDFMRAYDMKKQLEWVVKSSGIMGGRGQQPTVVDPTKYKERFRSAMNNYFLMIPDKATPWVIKHKKYQTLTDVGSEMIFDLH